MCRRGQSWPWTPGAGSPIQASAGQRWLFAGDSITALEWYAATGGFVEQLETLIGGSVAVLNSGLSGEQVINYASQVHGRVAIYSPDVVCLHIGINDVRVACADAVFAAAYESILYGIRAECPDAQLMVIGIGLMGEQWASDPLRWAPSADHGIDGKNAPIAALCATYGAAYVDYRGTALLYEEANNTPEPGEDLGILTGETGDNFHPNDDGKVLMGDAAMLHVEAA